MTVEIGGRRIGQDAPLFVVAEIGLNHGGSIACAVDLVDAAAAAGASAVKVQALDAAEMVAPDCRLPGAAPNQSLQEFYGRLELDEPSYRTIANRARAKGLAFLATPLSCATVDMLERVGVDAYKIASGDLTYDGLIERVSRTGKAIVMSTGMATIDEVGDAVSLARAAGARDIVLLHCVSAYPVPSGSENLLAVQTLARAFGLATGLSDHGVDGFAAPIALALGASIYERYLMLEGETGSTRLYRARRPNSPES